MTTRKDTISYNTSNLTDEELYPLVEKAVEKKVNNMSVKDLRMKLINEWMDYYLSYADDYELDIILEKGEM